MWQCATHPRNGTEHGSPPPLTTHDRELVSVVEVRIEPGDLNLRPLTPQSVTLPTQPRAGWSIKFKGKVKVFMASSLPVEYLLPQNVKSIINYLQYLLK